MWSTTVRTEAGPVMRIPNSQMVDSGARNWSQAYNWKAEYQLQLDGVPSDQIAVLIQGIRDILRPEEKVDQSWHLVHLARIEGNSRVIRVEYYPDGSGHFASSQLDADAYNDHFALTIDRVNLAILALLEREHIDPLVYTLFGGIEAYGGPQRGGGQATMVPVPPVEQRQRQDEG